MIGVRISGRVGEALKNTLRNTNTMKKTNKQILMENFKQVVRTSRQVGGGVDRRQDLLGG